MKEKCLYESPTSEVMEMNMQNVVCASQFSVVFLLTDDPNSAEIDWGREGYGAGGGENTWY